MYIYILVKLQTEQYMINLINLVKKCIFENIDYKILLFYSLFLLLNINSCNALLHSGNSLRDSE